MVQQEQNIPIDINTHKLLDWLISRRIVNADWQKSVLPIREKINGAIQDMPQHPEIAQLLSGAFINYFHCLRIVEILKETEADTKNVFGRYGSQRMKDWQEVIKLYEKDNLYLAEAAHLLISNIKYEVPNFKKQVAKCQQNKQECAKREIEYSKSENSARHELETTCKQLGIEGKGVKRELLARVKQLPEIYQRITEHMSTVKPATKYYASFAQTILGHDDVIPLIKYICENGNTTTYEWQYGIKPTSVEEPVLPGLRDDQEEESKEEEIDWGTSDDTINYEIDFDITLEESGIVLESEAGNEDSAAEGIAKGKQAYTLLDNPETREEFINQLLELESFLKVRLLEMQGDSDLLTLSHLTESTQSIAAMMDSVQVAKTLMTDASTQHLHNVKHSLRFLDHLTSTVEHKRTLIEKLVASQEAVRQKGKEAVQEAQTLQDKLKLIIDKTKELQVQIEQDISKKYKNRPVYLMGGVATL